MKLKALVLATSISLIGVASSSVTLQFSDAGYFGAGGESGVTWGVVVDTANDGFLGTYEAGWALTDGAILTGSGDDTFYLGGVTLAAPSIITNLLDKPDGIAAVPFALMWFDAGIAGGATTSGGDKYAMHTQGDFDWPNPGATQPYTVVGGGGNADTALVPEPSAAALGLLGVLGLLRRRR